MKFHLLLLFCSLNLIAQESDKTHNTNFVEAFYDKETKLPLYIYESINGNIVDTLTNVKAKNSWYKIAIVDSEYGWFKIKNVHRGPNVFKNYGYKNYWVKTSNFFISVDVLDENHRVYLYDEATYGSNRIHKIDNSKPVHIIETSGLWAMVTLKVGKKTVKGWLSFKDQCGISLDNLSEK